MLFLWLRRIFRNRVYSDFFKIFCFWSDFYSFIALFYQYHINYIMKINHKVRHITLKSKWDWYSPSYSVLFPRVRKLIWIKALCTWLSKYICTYPKEKSAFLMSFCIDNHQRNGKNHIKYACDTLLSIRGIHYA